jgi:hypothetical protein
MRRDVFIRVSQRKSEFTRYQYLLSKMTFSPSLLCCGQCCGSGMFVPDPGYEFFHPGCRVQKILDPGRI